MKSEDKNQRESNSKQEKDERVIEKEKHLYFQSRPANMPSHHLHLIFLLLFWCRFVADGLCIDIICLIQNELSYKNNLRSKATQFPKFIRPIRSKSHRGVKHNSEDKSAHITYCKDYYRENVVTEELKIEKEGAQRINLWEQPKIGLT